MKMHFTKWIGVCSALVFTLIFALSSEKSNAQVAINETFETLTVIPPGWTGTGISIFSQTGTTTPNQLNCGGIRGVRGNRWSSSTTGSLAAPLFVSNGSSLSVSFDYKIVNFTTPSPATPNTPAWGNVRLQYSVDGGTVYTDFLEINSTNHVSSTACANVSTSIPGSLLPTGNNIRIRVFSQWTAGDWYVYLDNVVLAQQATVPPLCNAALTSPVHGSTNGSASGNLVWSAASGAATGYNVTVTQLTGGPTVIYNQTLGNVLSVNVGPLSALTQYQVDIVPFNAFGNAAGCTSYTFTTLNPALCQAPLQISSLPFSTTDNTANYGDDYESVNLPAGPALFPAISTGSLSGSYLTGDDVVYAYTPSSNGGINIQIPTGHGTWLGVYVFTGCPFTQTVAFHLASTSTGRTINNIPVVGGTTYYIVISTFASPQSAAYTLNVTEVAFDCPELSANIGSTCSDGNPGTFGEVVTAECECVGTPYDCQNLNAQIGSACNDGNPFTVGDIVTGDCQCIGTLVEFAGCTNGTQFGSAAPVCDGPTSNITNSWTNEFSNITVATGNTYNFSLSVPTYFVTITDESLNILAFGLGSASYVANFSGIVRFYSTFGPNCPTTGGSATAHVRSVTAICAPVFDCPELSANIGDACDDGNAGTEGDIVLEDCSCAGTIIYDCPELQANIGDACDDGDANTENDTVGEDCSCAGTIIYDCPELSANIGDACDDGDATTEGDTILEDCSCVGISIYDCPALQANIGDACDDSDPTTGDDTVLEDCSCAGTPLLNETPCLAAAIACGDTISGSTVGVAGDNVPFCGTSDGTGGGLWYALTPSEAGLVTATTCGLAAFDTKIRVFNGSCDSLVCVAGNDDACGLQSSITFPATAGTTYYILVHGFAAAEGEFSLSVTCDPYDCAELGANIGTACDDNNPGTFNDTVQEDCTCAGTPYDCQEFNANIGSACASNGQTGLLDENCDCVVAGYAGCTNGTSFGTRNPTCTVAATPITGAWVNEFSTITVINQGTYTFSTTPNANIPVIYVTITTNTNPPQILAAGPISVVWQATFNGTVRFYSHGGIDCSSPVTGGASSHSRIVTINCSTIVFDCPALQLNFGAPCNDGNSSTFNDVVQPDCTCAGTPAQSNDTACAADSISCGGTVSGTTQGTTADVLGFCGTSDGTGGGVWYALTATENANIVATLCGGGTTFDSKLRVFTGACDALVCVTGNDDFCGLQSQVSFTASIGTTYYILVHGFGSASGAYSLAVTCETIFDCPALSANIGDACDDGNAATENDTVGADCTCVGTPIFDCPELSANIGDACDDGNAATENDTVGADCTCAGTPIFDCPELSANIGDACDDGDAGTENDVVSEDCTCSGTPINPCNVDGGTVASLSPRIGLCKGDGSADFVQLTVSGNVGVGLFGIVRQSDLQVVASNTSGLFNIENLPAGNYFAGHISVLSLSQLSGIANVNQLSGCFDLSNQLAITSIQLDGGTISAGGITVLCSGNITVTRSGNQGPQSRFVLLNETSTIVIAANNSGVFNFNSLVNGVYRIVSISSNGNVNLGAINPPVLPACVVASNILSVTKVDCPTALLSSTPNPTSDVSWVTFSVPTEDYTTLEVYDMSGRKVTELFNQVAEADAQYRLEFNGLGLPNGVYIYRLTTSHEVVIDKFMIAK